MPVTIYPAKHGASEYKTWTPPVQDAESLLKGARAYEAHADYKTLIQSSFPNVGDDTIYPQAHGFVNSAVQAYSRHHHLIIRPEDVWFAILTQLSIYINKHGEELRGTFVTHEGQKTLEVKTPGNLWSVDFGGLAMRMASLIEKNIIDPTLRQWIQPSFTTTTEEDVVVASVIMMGALKEYFSYLMSLTCGIPSVTLLGQKQDWEDILQRLERIKSLGDEPADWYRQLVPVITHFIKSFDSPKDPEVIDFWQRIAHYSGGGSGPTYLSGWITAFCFWSEKGKCMYSKQECDNTTMKDYCGNETPRLFLSGMPYHRINSNDIPPGHVSVPVQVNDNGTTYETMMVAGSVGVKLTSSGEKLGPSQDPYARLQVTDDPGVVQSDRTGLDTVQPVTGWFIFQLKSKEEKEKETSDKYSRLLVMEKGQEEESVPAEIEVIEVGVHSEL